jgi:hypothetical protein
VVRFDIPKKTGAYDRSNSQRRSCRDRLDRIANSKRAAAATAPVDRVGHGKSLGVLRSWPVASQDAGSDANFSFAGALLWRGVAGLT